MHDKYGKHHNEQKQLLVNLANSSRDHPRASTYKYTAECNAVHFI